MQFARRKRGLGTSTPLDKPLLSPSYEYRLLNDYLYEIKTGNNSNSSRFLSIVSELTHVLTEETFNEHSDLHVKPFIFFSTSGVGIKENLFSSLKNTLYNSLLPPASKLKHMEEVEWFHLQNIARQHHVNETFYTVCRDLTPEQILSKAAGPDEKHIQLCSELKKRYWQS